MSLFKQLDNDNRNPYYFQDPYILLTLSCFKSRTTIPKVVILNTDILVA